MTKLVDFHVLQKFDDPAFGYNIDVEEFYRNANQCQNDHPNFDGTVDTSSNAPRDGSLPNCFFNIPVIKASPAFSDTVPNICFEPFEGAVLNRRTPALPENLGFTDEFCLRAIGVL
jgi:hypothetical protein